MRTSVEMEIGCTFLGHSKVLSDPWEYDEKQASNSMEIQFFQVEKVRHSVKHDFIES